jgi:hypothetical protein
MGEEEDLDWMDNLPCPEAPLMSKECELEQLAPIGDTALVEYDRVSGRFVGTTALGAMVVNQATYSTVCRQHTVVAELYEDFHGYLLDRNGWCGVLDMIETRGWGLKTLE